MLANEVVFQALGVLKDSFDVELTAALEAIMAVSLGPPFQNNASSSEPAR